MEETTALIKPTEFEEMVKSFEEERRQEKTRLETDPNSSRNMARKDVIARQVQRAYTLLRGSGKPFTEMTVREFDLAQKEIKKRAEAKKQQLEREIESTWSFRMLKISRLGVSLLEQVFIFENGYKSHCKGNTFVALEKDVGHTNLKGVDWTKELPPNFAELIEKIFMIRHGQSVNLARKGEYGR